jgi:hypothetical protein
LSLWALSDSIPPNLRRLVWLEGWLRGSTHSLSRHLRRLVWLEGWLRGSTHSLSRHLQQRIIVCVVHFLQLKTKGVVNKLRPARFKDGSGLSVLFLVLNSLRTRQPAAGKKYCFFKIYLTANISQNYLTLYIILKLLPSSFICRIAQKIPQLSKKYYSRQKLYFSPSTKNFSFEKIKFSQLHPVLINFRISSPSKPSKQSVDVKIDLF